MLTTMESTEHHTWATEALRTFWRRTFTVLAVRSEQAAGDKLKQAQAYRAKLGEVR